MHSSAVCAVSGVLSTVSLPINAVVLPLVPVVMLAGFATGLVGLVHPLLAFPLAFVTHILLGTVLFIAETAAKLPFSHFFVLPFPWWMAALAYAPLTWLAYRTYLRQPSNLSS